MDRKALLLRLNQQRQQQASVPASSSETVGLAAPDTTFLQPKQLIQQYQLQLRTERTMLMWSECRQRLLHSIIGPFGLGTLVAAWDKMGGNVDTLHNVRAGVYATKEEQERYDSRGEYDSSAYHSHPTYKEKNAENSEKLAAGEAVDAYTGQPLERMDQDHMIPASEIHKDPAVWLAEENGPDLANNKGNLHPTDPSINRSKKQQSAKEFCAWLSKNRAERDTKIARLEEKANKEPLSKKEQDALAKYKQQNAIDQEKVLKLDEAARKQKESELRWSYYGGTKFGTYLLKTSAIEAGKMGLQQAIGLVLTDFVDSLLLEIHDGWHNGFCDGVNQKQVWEALKIRAERVAKRCLDNWRNVLAVFRDGAISGIISNLMTTLINTFFTTARNLVRMIREGVFSLFRAAKIILMRPKGTSLAEALDASLKVTVSGVFVIGGVFLEEYLSKTLGVLLSALPSGVLATLVAVLTGCVTGLISVLVVYMLDRIDLFGAQHQSEDSAILMMLQEGRAQADARLQALLGSDPEPA